ncbi:DUF4157 domain-containing protein [Phormidium tenue FACHB-886]|nr:DUF4157 domain-containing protein [Phormidium tenue FACHB-886]
MFDRLRIHRSKAASPPEQSIFRQVLQLPKVHERNDQHQALRRSPLPYSFSQVPVHLQAKLTVSQPNDPAEQEADRMADQVVRMQVPHSSQEIGRSLQTSVQRKCATCETEERQTQQQAESDQPTAQVQRVVQSGGQPLDADTQAFMKPRFGFDFSQVRIHADEQASQSAEAVNAQAYTLGNHIVFRSGQYAPETEAGKRLLAHELTHVVQQQSGNKEVQRVCAACEEERIMRQEDGEQPAASPGLDLSPKDGIEPGPAQIETSSLDIDLAALLSASSASAANLDTSSATPEDTAMGTAAKSSCVPNRALSWADFKGSPSGSFSAETAYDIKLQVANGTASIAAIFNSSKSWVKSEYKNPSSLTDTRCDKAISSCEDWFAENSSGTWGPLKKDVTKCAASVAYSASAIANSKSECSSVVGAECTRVAGLESTRLLSHEQTHFDIGCVIADKGTAALIAAPSGDQQNVLNRVKRAVKDQNKKYDDDTKHGCDSSAQSRWQSDVNSGLGSIKI